MSDSLQQKLNERKKKIAVKRKRFAAPPAVGIRTGLRSQDDTPSGSERESLDLEDYVSTAELFEVKSPTMADEVKDEKKSSAAADAQFSQHVQQPPAIQGPFEAAASSSSQQADFQRKEEQRYSHVSSNIERVFQDMCDKVLRQQEELSNVVRAVDKRLSTIESRPAVLFPEVTSQSQGVNPMVQFSVPPPPAEPVVNAMASGFDYERQQTSRHEIAPDAHVQSTPKRRRSNSLSTPRRLTALPEETDDETARRRRKHDGSRNRKQSKAVNKSKNTSKSSDVDISSCTIESDDDSETSETASTTSSTGSKFVKNINLKVPRFNGKNFHIFKPRFEAVARRRGLNEEQKCDLLTQVLEGDAERVLSWVLPELWSYETLMKEAELQFTDNKSYADVLTEMLSMRRKAGDSLHEFAHKIQQASRQAEMAEDERQRLTRQAFVVGLADYPLMRAYVEREDRKKDCLRTAVALAVKYEKEHCVEKTADRTAAKVTTEVQQDDNDEADVNRFFTQRGQSYRGRGRGGYHGGRDQRTLEDEIAKLREEMAQLKLSQGATAAQPVSEKSNVEGEKKQYYDKKSSRWNYRGKQRGRGRSRFWQYVNGQYVPYNPQQQPQFKDVQAAMAFPPPPPLLAPQPAPTTTTTHHVPVQHMAAQTVAPPILYEDAADDSEQPSDEQE